MVFTTLQVNVPTISTSSISYLRSNTAICGGNISDNGNAIVNSRGVCWSTTSNPTIGLSTKTVDGSGIGSFTSSITGLTENTTYYVRSYATNVAGTAYGNEVLLKTIILDTTIGSQVWTVRNLNESTYRDGTPIPKVEDAATWASLTTGAYCYYDNDSATYAAVYGKLYNSFAVRDNTHGGLAPSGYHIPTDAEWTTLETTLGPNILTKIKSTSGWNVNGTNSSGFTALPGGYRSYTGGFGSIGIHSSWWSSTQYDSIFTWYRFLSLNNIGLYRNAENNTFGYSIRCVKN